MSLGIQGYCKLTSEYYAGLVLGRHRLGEQLGDPSPDEARPTPGSGDDLPPDDTEEDEETPASNPLPASVPAAEDDGSGSHSVEVSSSLDPDPSPKVIC